jgi:hypothetical protein
MSSARWLVPSVVAGCAGGLVAGLIDAVRFGPVEAIAVVGFGALVTIPALIVISVVARGLVAAWPVTIEDGGGAPGLAGWLAFVWLGAIGLAWAMFEGTWLVHAWTQFKPLVVRIAEPLIALAAISALVVISRPFARLLAAAVRAIDSRWRRWRYAWLAAAIAGVVVAVAGFVFGGVGLGAVGLAAGAVMAWRAPRGSLATPIRIAVVTIAGSAILAVVVWRWIVKPKLLGANDFGPLYVTCAALAATAVVHLVWPRLAHLHRRIALATSAVTMIAVVGAAVIAFVRPDVALRLWGDPSFAGRALTKLFDPDALRDRFEIDAPPSRTDTHPDVVVITLDGVREDRAALIPTYRQLTAKGVSFAWAFAPSNGPHRSLAAIASGLAANRITDPRRVSFVERLRSAGYTTAVFAPTGDVPARGFDHDVRVRDSATLVSSLATWLAQPRHEPRFAWLDLADARDVIPYERALANTEALLARVLASLPASAIVVVTAAHGIGLGEHGQTGFGVGLYNSQTHVPLAIVGPGIAHDRIDDTVSLVDLGPTIIDLAGFDPPSGSGADGRSLVPLVAGAHLPAPLAQVAPLADDRSIGIVGGRFKLILTGGITEVYDVRVDSNERTNLRTLRTTPLAELRRQLDRMIRREATSPLN